MLRIAKEAFKRNTTPFKTTGTHAKKSKQKCITLISCQSFKAHAGVFKKLQGFVQWDEVIYVSWVFSHGTVFFPAITHFPFQFGSAFRFGRSGCVSIRALRVYLGKNPQKISSVPPTMILSVSATHTYTHTHAQFSEFLVRHSLRMDSVLQRHMSCQT